MEKVNILLVDDRPENLVALETLLKTPDLNLIKANSGNEALSLLLKHDLALVLLDVQMPEMDGFEVAKLMRGLVQSQSIPIIFVTAINQDRKFISEGYSLGAVDFLFKPIDSDILKSKVNIFIELYKNKKKLTEDALGFEKLNKEISKKSYALQETNQQLTQSLQEVQIMHEKLQQTQIQLLQSEKMASIGQLAAGVAHEINNPVGFVSSNMQILEKYVADYSKYLNLVEDLQKKIDENDIEQTKVLTEKLKNMKDDINLDFLMADANNLVKESQKGLERVKNIVMDLRTFARDGQDISALVKIEEVIDGVLNIVDNEIKYKAELKKEYAEIPQIKCNASRLGQVFVNLFINAVQAIKEKGIIKVKTYIQEKNVCIEISDTGEGIEKEKLKDIFNPFYTTKAVGKGTGLGLSISYDIVKKHNGQIIVESEAGKGTVFTIMLPLP